MRHRILTVTVTIVLIDLVSGQLPFKNVFQSSNYASVGNSPQAGVNYGNLQNFAPYDQASSFFNSGSGIPRTNVQSNTVVGQPSDASASFYPQTSNQRPNNNLQYANYLATPGGSQVSLADSIMNSLENNPLIKQYLQGPTRVNPVTNGGQLIQNSQNVLPIPYATGSNPLPNANPSYTLPTNNAASVPFFSQIINQPPMNNFQYTNNFANPVGSQQSLADSVMNSLENDPLIKQYLQDPTTSANPVPYGAQSIRNSQNGFRFPYVTGYNPLPNVNPAPGSDTARVSYYPQNAYYQAPINNIQSPNFFANPVGSKLSSADSNMNLKENNPFINHFYQLSTNPATNGAEFIQNSQYRFPNSQPNSPYADPSNRFLKSPESKSFSELFLNYPPNQQQSNNRAPNDLPNANPTDDVVESIGQIPMSKQTFDNLANAQLVNNRSLNSLPNANSSVSRSNFQEINPLIKQHLNAPPKHKRHRNRGRPPLKSKKGYRRPFPIRPNSSLNTNSRSNVDKYNTDVTENFPNSNKATNYTTISSFSFTENSGNNPTPSDVPTLSRSLTDKPSTSIALSSSYTSPDYFLPSDVPIEYPKSDFPEGFFVDMLKSLETNSKSASSVPATGSSSFQTNSINGSNLLNYEFLKAPKSREKRNNKRVQRKRPRKSKSKETIKSADASNSTRASTLPYHLEYYTIKPDLKTSQMDDYSISLPATNLPISKNTNKERKNPKKISRKKSKAPAISKTNDEKVFQSIINLAEISNIPNETLIDKEGKKTNFPLNMNDSLDFISDSILPSNKTMSDIIIKSTKKKNTRSKRVNNNKLKIKKKKKTSVNYNASKKSDRTKISPSLPHSSVWNNIKSRLTPSKMGTISPSSKTTPVITSRLTSRKPKKLNQNQKIKYRPTKRKNKEGSRKRRSKQMNNFLYNKDLEKLSTYPYSFTIFGQYTKSTLSKVILEPTGNKISPKIISKFKFPKKSSQKKKNKTHKSKENKKKKTAMKVNPKRKTDTLNDYAFKNKSMSPDLSLNYDHSIISLPINVVTMDPVNKIDLKTSKKNPVLKRKRKSPNTKKNTKIKKAKVNKEKESVSTNSNTIDITTESINNSKLNSLPNSGSISTLFTSSITRKKSSAEPFVKLKKKKNEKLATTNHKKSIEKVNIKYSASTIDTMGNTSTLSSLPLNQGREFTVSNIVINQINSNISTDLTTSPTFPKHLTDEFKLPLTQKNGTSSKNLNNKPSPTKMPASKQNKKFIPKDQIHKSESIDKKKNKIETNKKLEAKKSIPTNLPTTTLPYSSVISDTSTKSELQIAESTVREFKTSTNLQREALKLSLSPENLAVSTSSPTSNYAYPINYSVSNEYETPKLSTFDVTTSLRRNSNSTPNVRSSTLLSTNANAYFKKDPHITFSKIQPSTDIIFNDSTKLTTHSIKMSTTAVDNEDKRVSEVDKSFKELQTTLPTIQEDFSSDDKVAISKTLMNASPFSGAFKESVIIDLTTVSTSGLMDKIPTDSTKQDAAATDSPESNKDTDKTTTVGSASTKQDAVVTDTSETNKDADKTTTVGSDPCGADEVWWDCKPLNNTCTNVARGKSQRNFVCEPGCYCKKDLVKDVDGTCVDPDDCAAPVCREEDHEEITDCLIECNRCEDDCHPCQMQSCVDGCDCKDGYKRNNDGKCVLDINCPPCLTAISD